MLEGDDAEEMEDVGFKQNPRHIGRQRATVAIMAMP
jgi:hypothetical protein